jgi:hypothetical protein
MERTSLDPKYLTTEIASEKARIEPSSDTESNFSPLATCPEQSVDRFRRRGDLAVTSYRAAVELKCLECCAWERPEAQRCAMNSCPLWALSERIFHRSLTRPSRE